MYIYIHETSRPLKKCHKNNPYAQEKKRKRKKKKRKKKKEKKKKIPTRIIPGRISAACEWQTGNTSIFLMGVETDLEGKKNLNQEWLLMF